MEGFLKDLIKNVYYKNFMNRFLIFCFLFCSIFGKEFSNLVAQEDYFLTPQDKAYLFHTVRKSPILEQNIGRYFHYAGPEILLPNGEVNYDSIELKIINQPELLIIMSEEIRKAPKGILAEAANKQAVWELNKLLHAKRKNNIDKEGLSYDYENFERVIISRLPTVAFKQKGGGMIIHPKVENIFNPNLSFNEKVAMLEGFGNWTVQDRKQVLDAMNYAINHWVENRAFSIFQKLGGEADTFINVLTAAGDGSTTSGLFEEREKDEKGRWNRGLPKAVGLFPYFSEIVIDENKKKGKEKLEPMRYSILDFETVGGNKQTNIHLDVWGYNSEKQTTVVIEKNAKAYPLFGSTESRFLSPDSTFGGSGTYYTMINRVKADIVDLEEKISGKKGFDYKIAYFEKKKSDKLLQIDKTEKELNDMRMRPIVTNDKKLKTKSGGKARRKKQEAVVAYYNQLAAIKKKIKELQEQKQRAIELMQQKERQVHHMLDLIGRNWVPFKEKDGLYIFEDSTTFDLYTQEFTFPPSKKDSAWQKEPFEIRLIAIPYSHVSNEVDEVMLHVNIVDVRPKYDAKVQLILEDVFASNSFELSNPLFQPKDSLSVVEFFEALLRKDLSFNLIMRGAGVGKWNGYRTVADRSAQEVVSYIGKTSEERSKNRESEEMKRLRVSYVDISLNRAIQLEVNSFTDPVTTNFVAPSKVIQEKVASYKLTGNQVLSAYRTYTIAKKMQQELNVLAGMYLSREDAKKVIDRMNKKFQKGTIYVGRTSFKWKDF